MSSLRCLEVGIFGHGLARMSPQLGLAVTRHPFLNVGKLMKTARHSYPSSTSTPSVRTVLGKSARVLGVGLEQWFHFKRRWAGEVNI